VKCHQQISVLALNQFQIWLWFWCFVIVFSVFYLLIIVFRIIYPFFTPTLRKIPRLKLHCCLWNLRQVWYLYKYIYILWETRQFGTRWKRQFGTKTFRHPLKKTVRHQDISVPLKKSVKSTPHFLSNKRDYLF
jgi:hypothetical protein